MYEYVWLISILAIAVLRGRDFYPCAAGRSLPMNHYVCYESLVYPISSLHVLSNLYTIMFIRHLYTSISASTQAGMRCRSFRGTAGGSRPTTPWPGVVLVQTPKPRASTPPFGEWGPYTWNLDLKPETWNRRSGKGWGGSALLESCRWRLKGAMCFESMELFVLQRREPASALHEEPAGHLTRSNTTSNQIVRLKWNRQIVGGNRGGAGAGVLAFLFAQDPVYPNPEPRTPNPETQNPNSETRNPKPEIRDPKPEIMNPKSWTLNQGFDQYFADQLKTWGCESPHTPHPTPWIPNTKPQTLHPKPLNPKFKPEPWTLNPTL